MKKSIFARLGALCVSAAMCVAMVAPVPAFAAGAYSPVGMWEADNGETRYNVDLCGDGAQLCAVLSWIRPDLVDNRNSAHLNQYVIDHARPGKQNEWRGDINIFGNKVAGSVRMLSPEVMQVRGCALLILCERYLLIRMGDVETASTE